MDFFQLLQKRRAAHTFIPGRTIPDEDLLEMIEHTSLAPSGYNAQPWDFIIIRKPEHITELQEIAFDQPHVQNASAIIIVLGDTNIGRYADRIIQDWIDFGYCSAEKAEVYKQAMTKTRSESQRQTMALRNAMLAAMTLIFSAENMGYATCPMMGFSKWKLRKKLNIPEDRIMALMIAIGQNHPDQEKPRLPRKSVDEMVHWEKFEKGNA